MRDFTSICGRIVVMLLIPFSCSQKIDRKELSEGIRAIDLSRGEITLCGTDVDQFGNVSFGLSCSENVRSDFNLATALLHSFEYTEAEKVFVRVIDADPECVMGYWGIAMCNFHPLWTPPTPDELRKGEKVVALARSITKGRSSRESTYLEAIATIYDGWDSLAYRARLLKFEEASRTLFERYPDDNEAAIFYALALNAAADPADKTFVRQKKAGGILNSIFDRNPAHPGIAHYLIHNYDYPELAELALPAARKYASIAAASAHAQHMPSHIFIRLGLWDEATQSNIKSISAAQCYAEQSGMKGHWDEELHGLDYLLYAYLQKADDLKAHEQLKYLQTINEVFPVNFKDAYAFASMPARYALERKDWSMAADLKVAPAQFPWEKFLWEKANIHFARVLGAVHTGKIRLAEIELERLDSIHSALLRSDEKYKANLVLIQKIAAQAWITFSQGKKSQAFALMTEAAVMEDATAKHPVTPGEIVPARDLLADMLMESGDYQWALKEYEADLAKHPNRLNGILGAAIAARKAGNSDKAKKYQQQLLMLTGSNVTDRPQLSMVLAR
jgi:hypothetical protein